MTTTTTTTTTSTTTIKENNIKLKLDTNKRTFQRQARVAVVVVVVVVAVRRYEARGSPRSGVVVVVVVYVSLPNERKAPTIPEHGLAGKTNHYQSPRRLARTSSRAHGQRHLHDFRQLTSRAAPCRAVPCAPSPRRRADCLFGRPAGCWLAG